MKNITGTLKKIIWRSLENDFTIASFDPEKSGPEFIATGDLHNPSDGIAYELTGKWTDHHKYGKQFKIQSYTVPAPVEPDALALYLEKYIKGIGPAMAEKLINQYGKDTIPTLKEFPIGASQKISGLSLNLAMKISEQLQEDDKRQVILIQLEGIFSKVKGLPKKLASDVLKLYGLTAFEMVKANPYILINMSRMGFLSADKVAIVCGVAVDDPERIKQCIMYIIKQSMQETGDVWIRHLKIQEEIENYIKGLKVVDVSLAVGDLIKNNLLTKYEKHVTITQIAADEDLIADCVIKFL